MLWLIKRTVFSCYHCGRMTRVVFNAGHYDVCAWMAVQCLIALVYESFSASNIVYYRSVAAQFNAYYTQPILVMLLYSVLCLNISNVWFTFKVRPIIRLKHDIAGTSFTTGCTTSAWGLELWLYEKIGTDHLTVAIDNTSHSHAQRQTAHVRTFTFAYAFTFIRARAQERVCLHVCMCVCVCACVRSCV